MRDGARIPARTYRRPDVHGAAPVVVYYHGGGWTLGRPLDYESPLTMIADETGALVLAPDYRKAPEHKAPTAVLDTYKSLYLDGAPVAADDAQISPLQAASHEGAAPALIQTAEFDPLAPEGADYAAALQRSGVATRLTHYRGVPHGFLNIPGAAPVAWQARWEIVDALQGWFA
ncbi:alpha/beta hydrolase [Flexivirga oryzae]|uniref:Acetyl esterase/lipase n=1 Tax=Flexivirga oryzae TaxID=1794944 RepID=A0A839N7K2_9MICO|nr:alpha/beta hydrolase fold domain-containing protein [Flexivirga oryzae]MBB2891616.1 acetyl esterase/lipase [Flexivirga oryzae]